MGSMMRFLWLLMVGLGLGTRRHINVLIAILAGALLGIIAPQVSWLMPAVGVFDVLGQLFIRMVMMLVIPMVVSSLIVGLGAIKNEEDLNRIGGKTFTWFLTLMILGSVVGLFLVSLFKPGLSLQADMQQLLANTHSTMQTAGVQLGQATSLKDLLIHLIPDNPIQALSTMDMLPILLFTLVLGVACNRIGEAGKPVVQFFESLYMATMKMTHWVMMFSVIGVFSLAFSSVARLGVQVFSHLVPFALTVLGGLAVLLFVVLPMVLFYGAKVSPVKFYQSISEAMMVGFGTASYGATLPITMACAEQRTGLSHKMATFVLPMGANMKLATAMFEVIATVFLAQAMGLSVGLYEAILITVLSVVASIAAPGVPSAGLVTLAIITKSLGGSYAQLASAVVLLWPIDRLLDMFRTMVNVAGGVTVATLVASSEGEVNEDILNHQVLWKDDMLKA
ncbi:MAG: dicarboxylate/amino acid:cation symporter [Vampirovibrionales bacterium]